MEFQKAISKSMNDNIKRILSNNVKTRITCAVRKLCTKFQIKIELNINISII